MDIDYFRFLIALLFVVGLILLFAYVARRAGLGGMMAGQSGRLGRRATRRIGVVEVAPLDARRRLVLVRRDDTEHLLLLGPNGDLVVEGGIRPDAARESTAVGSERA